MTKLAPGARTSFADVGLGAADPLAPSDAAAEATAGEAIGAAAGFAPGAEGDDSLVSGARRLPQPTSVAIIARESAARARAVFIGGVLMSISASRSSKRTTGPAR